MEFSTENPGYIRWGVSLLLAFQCISCTPGPDCLFASAEAIHGAPAGNAKVVQSPVGSRWAVMITGVRCSPGAIIDSDLQGNDKFIAPRPAGASLNWSGDGTLMIYGERAEREIPGQYVDWNVPAVETLGGRLWAVSPNGGQPQLLAEGQKFYSSAPAPAGPYVAYATTPMPRGAAEPVAFHLRNLQTGEDEVLVSEESASGFQWSPDSSSVAYLERQPQGGGYSVVVVDRFTRVRKQIPGVFAEQFFWQGKKICLVPANNVQSLLIYDLADDSATTVSIDLPFKILGPSLGWYRPSPDGNLVLVHSAKSHDPIELRYTVFSIPERRAIDMTEHVPPRHQVLWRDNQHLVALPPAIPLKAKSIEVRFEATAGASGASEPAEPTSQ